MNKVYEQIDYPEVGGYLFATRTTGKPVSVQFNNQEINMAFAKYGIKAQNASSFTFKKTYLAHKGLEQLM